MVTYLEPILKQRLWHWLEEQGMDVDAEVDVGEGQIDLVTLTTEGEYWGIEIKEGGSAGIVEQANRYANSGFLDRIFLASNYIGYQNTDGITPEPGLINVPLTVHRGVIRNAESVLSPGDGRQPEIKQIGGKTSRSKDPEISRTGEPWVRHSVWEEYGGLPEGHVPNTMATDQSYRPIDILAFSDSIDPSVVVQNPDGNKLIGIEAKGESSFQPTRIKNQLSQFLEPSVLSKLYLAVPSSLESEAKNLISSFDQVGILSVSTDGHVEEVEQASEMTPKHDGYLDMFEEKKVAYGDLSINEGREISSVYVTEQEAERIEHQEAAPYAKKILKDREKPDEDWLEDVVPEEMHTAVDEFDLGYPARAYLLKGCSADPGATMRSRDIADNQMKPGYVRLTITDFEIQGSTAFKLQFGRNEWEGGYIVIVGERIEKLLNILIALEDIEGGEVCGQGRIMNLDEYFDELGPDERRLSDHPGTIGHRKLVITSNKDTEYGSGSFCLGAEREGAEASFTEPQRLDLIASIDILRDGNQRQLPGEYSTYPRIGSAGDDTWGLGTDIENEVNPSSPAWSDTETPREKQGTRNIKKLLFEEGPLPEKDLPRLAGWGDAIDAGMRDFLLFVKEDIDDKRPRERWDIEPVFYLEEEHSAESVLEVFLDENDEVMDEIAKRGLTPMVKGYDESWAPIEEVFEASDLWRLRSANPREKQESRNIEKLLEEGPLIESELPEPMAVSEDFDAGLTKFLIFGKQEDGEENTQEVRGTPVFYLKGEHSAESVLETFFENNTNIIKKLDDVGLTPVVHGYNESWPPIDEASETLDSVTIRWT